MLTLLRMFCFRGQDHYFSNLHEYCKTLQERLSVEKTIEEGLQELPSHLKGTYYRLGEIPEDERLSLVKKHILYNDHDK